MVMAREATPALACISAVADRLSAGVMDLAMEDRRYSGREPRSAALRTLTIVSGRSRAIVLNGNASRSSYDVVDVRLTSPLDRLYSTWRVPAIDDAPDGIADAIVAFCDGATPGQSRSAVEAGIGAAAEILDALGAARLGR